MLTIYSFYNTILPFTFTIVDTPGFNDTRGKVERPTVIVILYRTKIKVQKSVFLKV
jgi:hypothetical protein